MKQSIINAITIFVIISVAFVISNLIVKCDNKPPIEENIIVIDSLNTKNDSIKNKIKELEKDRDNEIITIIHLNNDSTIELFKKLVRE